VASQIEKNATANRMLLDMAAKMHPNGGWQDQRWVVDGKFWTSGGTSAGKFEQLLFSLLKATPT
jgi:hypothetical protein